MKLPPKSPYAKILGAKKPAMPGAPMAPPAVNTTPQAGADDMSAMDPAINQVGAALVDQVGAPHPAMPPAMHAPHPAPAMSRMPGKGGKPVGNSPWAKMRMK
jgi:hypothetical protein